LWRITYNKEIYMSNNEEWEYHHTTDSGHRVNEDGYDQNGQGHNYDVRPSSNRNSSSGSGGSYNEADFEARSMLVIAKLVLLGLAVFILYKVNLFFIENWVTVVTVLGAFIICAIACFFIIVMHKGKGKLGLKIFIAIVASLGIMGAILSFIPVTTGETMGNALSPAAIQEKETILQGGAKVGIVNIRSAPSMDADIIGFFSKDDLIQITGKIGSWWEVKFENGGGYVDSVYVEAN
jgi:hypothetical protein